MWSKTEKDQHALLWTQCIVKHNGHTIKLTRLDVRRIIWYNWYSRRTLVPENFDWRPQGGLVSILCWYPWYFNQLFLFTQVVKLVQWLIHRANCNSILTCVTVKVIIFLHWNSDFFAWSVRNVFCIRDTCKSPKLQPGQSYKLAQPKVFFSCTFENCLPSTFRHTTGPPVWTMILHFSKLVQFALHLIFN